MCTYLPLGTATCWLVAPFVISRAVSFFATCRKWFKKLTTKINDTSYRVSFANFNNNVIIETSIITNYYYDN